MRRIISYIGMFFITLPLFAQIEANYWYFGKNAGLKFEKKTPTILTDGKLNTLEGCAVMSDRMGNLLFYTDGITVWNSKHEIMKNGMGLKGGKSSTQSAFIIPVPGSIKEYYLFTAPSRTDDKADPIVHYSMISFAADPDGEVTKKNTILCNEVGEKLTGTVECNVGGFWILTHHIKKAIFYAFHVTPNGINTTPVISNFGDEYSSSAAGYLKFSTDGNRIATGMGVFSNTARLCLFDFDKTTGKVHNRRILEEGKKVDDFYGVSFSPDNSKLYATSGEGILQYDVTSNNLDTIIKSKYFVMTEKAVGALQITRFGEIYYSPFEGTQIAVIGFPNRSGSYCHYLSDGPKFPCEYGLPNFLDYMFNVGYGSNISCFDYIGLIDTIKGCPGTAFTITHKSSKGAYDRQWEVENAKILQQQDSTIQCIINELGTYKVRLIYKYKTFTDTLNSKIIISLPIAEAGEDGYYCTDTVPVEHYFDVVPVKGYKYQWMPIDGLTNHQIANPRLRVGKTQQYILTVTSEQGCISRDTVLINFNKAIPLKVGGNVTTCRGHAVQIQASGGERYNWSPSTGLSDSTAASPWASPQHTTEYKLVAWTGNCKDSAIVTVIVKDPPKVSASSTTICKGKPAQLFASGGDTYTWVPSNGLSNPKVPNPIATPDATTEYKVYVTYAHCIDSASITIIVKDAPIADAGHNRKVCTGTSVILGNKAQMDNIYSWSPKEYLQNPDSAETLCAPLKNMRYILTVKNKNGCTDYDTVTITVGTELSVFANGDTSICKGTPVQLSVQGAEKYTWYPTEGLNNTEIDSPIATPQKTTMYYVRGSIGECTGMDSVLITVSEYPNLTVSEAKEVCLGESAQLRANGAERYEWYPAEGLTNTNIANPIATPQKTTLYYVKGINNICEKTDSVLITVSEHPILTVSEDKEICIGEIVQLTVSGAERYEWSPAEGLDNAFISNPSTKPYKTTMYYVKGTKNNCESTDSILITVSTKPELTISNDTTICEGETIQLKAQGANKYEWLPKNVFDNPNNAHQIVTPTETSTYTVIGKNNICTDTAQMTVTVQKPQKIFFRITTLPNTFFTVGSLIPISIIIPEDISSTLFSFYYDECCLHYTDTFSTTLQGVHIINEHNGKLTVSADIPNKQGGEITLKCMLLLPNDRRLIQSVFLDEIILPDNLHDNCTRAINDTLYINYDPVCAWDVRGVQISDKFAITLQEEKAILHTGMGGKTTLSIYDMSGQEVWKTENTYPSSSEVEISLPELSGGVYILRAANYGWKKDVVIVR